MKAIVFGLGSMGKRRIRCLRHLGIAEIVGVDLREDRRAEVQERYNITTFAAFQNAILDFVPDIAIISVPPKVHVEAMRSCIERGIPFFVEASVVDEGLDEIIELVRKNGIVAAPSTTLYFHPAIQEVFKIVRSGVLGDISNVMLHSGQYLPDWHAYESVGDYYVSDPATGGAREIVPFEMTWVTDLFGFPRRVAGNYRKTIEIDGAPLIDDTYNCILDYGSFLATLTVDVVSRHATRRLLINGKRGQLVWSWDQNSIRVFDGDSGNWSETPYKMEGAEAGYNENIGENMYIDEIRAFLKTVAGEEKFPNSLEKDHKVLKLLYAIERSDQTAKFQDF